MNQSGNGRAESPLRRQERLNGRAGQPVAAVEQPDARPDVDGPVRRSGEQARLHPLRLYKIA